MPVLLDGAHNPAGVDALRTYLTGSTTPGRARVFFSVMRDKDFLEVYRALRAITDDIVFIDMSALFPRALPAAEFRAALSAASDVPTPDGGRLREASLTFEGLEPLLRRVSGAENSVDYAVFCGSLFLLGEVIPLLLSHYQGLEEFEELVAEKNLSF